MAMAIFIERDKMMIHQQMIGLIRVRLGETGEFNYDYLSFY